MDITDMVHPVIIRRSRLLFVACVLGAGQLQAQLFVPIDINSNLHDLDIEVTKNQFGTEVQVGIHNKEAFEVECTAHFNNGPQTSIERRAVIKAGKTGQMMAPLFREVTRVNVDLSCDRRDKPE